MVAGYVYRTAVLLLVFLSVTAVACLLGWLRDLYYFQTFGVELYLLDRSPFVLLLDSWFVVQNVLFFVLLWWIVVKTRLIWTVVVGVFYSLIPIAAHYSFLFHDSVPAQVLIRYRHTLLKLVPFVLLVVVWSFWPRHRQALRSLAWPHGGAGLALFVLITLSWSVSTAKHTGSFDANRAMRWSDTYLQRVSLEAKPAHAIPAALDGNPDLFLVFVNEQVLVVWDRSDFRYRHAARVRTVVVPRADVEWIETRKCFQIQPGSQFL